MKWNDKYPTANYMDELEPGILKGGERSGPCAICKETTNWVDIAFEAYLCSEECVDQLNQEWLKACAEPR